MSKPFVNKSYVSVIKLNPAAEYPNKEGRSLIYNVTAVSRTNNRAEDSAHDTNDFNTGISFVIPDGYYLELTAHQSLHKHGYLFVGPCVIDQNATAELIITLFKFKDGDDIELPMDLARLVLKENVSMHFAGTQKKIPSYQDDEFGGFERDRSVFERTTFEEKKEKPINYNPKQPKNAGKNPSFF